MNRQQQIANGRTTILESALLRCNMHAASGALP
jgi:hypothetical protein